MSTSLATTPAPGAVSKTGIILANMDEIWRFSETVIASGLAPKGITNASAATIIIQMGMELGLPPMASLQNIAAINGRPSIWGDAMLGVVRATGELEEFTEWYELKGQRLPRAPIEFPDELMAVCRVKRRGYDPVETSFSVADAKRAKLWGKQGPWTEYTARMLKFRARSFNLRDEFGDALRGLYSAEEERDMPMREAVGHVVETTAQTRVITGDSTPPPSAKEAAPAKTAKATAPAKENPAPAPSAATRPDMVDGIRKAFKAAGHKLPAAEEIARTFGLLQDGEGFSGLDTEKMGVVFARRYELYPPPEETPATEEAPTEGGTEQ